MAKMKLIVLVSFCTINVVTSLATTNRDSRKLFGGYRITPKFCRATKKPTADLGGPNICMFNHECIQRNGQVVGACMDGFLFGACCQVPEGSAGELMESELLQAQNPSNVILSKPTSRPDISGGISQITQSLLDTHYGSTVKIPSSTPSYEMEEKKTTTRNEDEYTPLIHISISGVPEHYTPTPGFLKPMFRPKPTSSGDQYVLVPTISHSVSGNKTENADAIANIIEMLENPSSQSSSTYSTTKKPPSTSYVFSSTPSRRPGYEGNTQKPSTSYTFQSPPTNPSVVNIKPKPTVVKLPTPTTTTKYTYPTTKFPYSPYRPSGHSTIANTPDAFYSTGRPTSLYTSTPSRNPAPSTLSTYLSGPSFSVSSSPGQFSNYPSPAPTLIVLAPAEESGADYSTRRPVEPKPVTQLTINNHITQNIYSTQRPPPSTVVITPKPGASSPVRRPEQQTSSVTSSDDLNNFPPVRNPNLNMSALVLDENDITTPTFVEDQVLDQKVESFVNNIIQGLQDPFQDLKEVLYNNKTSTSAKPTRQGTSTKKPVTKPVSSNSKPTRRPTTNRPASSTIVTKKPTTKRTKPTKKTVITTTTTPSYIETEENTSPIDSDDYRSQCGKRPLIKTGRIVGGKGATFGEFPWQVLIRELTWFGLFTKNKCGGVLISNRYVMTAAHCQPGFLASLVAVFGELDISGDRESKRPISRNVKRVIVHRKYDPATFENDLALLELEHPVQFDSHIVPICLPSDTADFTGRMATVTGWGRLMYGGGVPSVLQEVQVPIMENQVCQEMFRTAGHSKIILESFLCAGYANGQKDSCEGDSGGPLVLQRPDGRYQLAGTVSHGIKCAAPYLPGVYMRTTYYKPWITSITGLQ